MNKLPEVVGKLLGALYGNGTITRDELQQVTGMTDEEMKQIIVVDQDQDEEEDEE